LLSARAPAPSGAPSRGAGRLLVRPARHA